MTKMLMRAGGDRRNPGPSGSGNQGGSTTGAIDLKPLLQLLRWNAGRIAACAVIVACLAAALLFIIPASFTATAVVLLDPREARVTASQQVLPGIGNDAAAVESQVEVVQSTAVAQQVIAKLHLDQDPEFGPGLIERLLADVGVKATVSPEQQLSRLIEKFQKKLSVKRRGLSYILEVGFSLSDPDKAARVANAVAEAYISQQQALRNSLTEDASTWLDGRIDALRQRLRRSEQAIADYRAANHVVDVSQGSKLIQRRLEDVSRELAVAQLRKAEVGGRLQQIDAARKVKGGTAALAEMMPSATIATLRARYADYAGIEARYSTQYGRKHPLLVSVRAQLAELEAQIGQQVERVIAGMRDDYAAASRQQDALEAEMTNLKGQSETLDQVGVQLGTLTREADADRALFNQYLGRLKETNQEQTLRFDNARVVSPALPPLKPNRPSALILLAAAGFAGLMLGSAVSIFSENFRTGLQSAQEVESALAVSCLAIIPADGGRLSSGAAERARSITALAMRLRRSSGQSGKVVAVTSALDGEGKSSFAKDIATAAAGSGAPVLLLYADQASADPSVPQASLQELREGDLTSVGGTLFAARLAHEPGAKRSGLPKDVLAEIGPRFDLIVIDAPALIPTGGSASIDMADRIVVVARWNSTDRAAVADAIAMLAPLGDREAGVVLADASPRWYRLFVQGKYTPARAPKRLVTA